ncbi:MAG: hypothetical protein E7338_02265 [Clostridiales bacterium]|nr:hypothetical protein [Clostridiales bacterium]
MAETKQKKVTAQKPEKKKAATRSKVESNKLELLVTIVNRQKAEFYMDLIQSYEANMQMACQAQGTATPDMRKILGLVDIDKTVIFSVVQESRVSDIMYQLSKRFRTIKNGGGIAYTIPLASVIGVAVYTFLSNNKDAVKEGN